MGKKWLALIGLLLCGSTLGAGTHTPAAVPTDDALHVHLGAENSWPPYSDEKGQGISTELIKAAFAQRGIVPSFRPLPYARVLHDLTSGKIDGGFNVSRQASTEAKYVFGDVPLFEVEAYWFFLRGTHQTIQSFNDIPDNFRVGVIRDYEYGDEYEQHRHRFNETKVSQQAQIIRMLKQGRIDAGIMFKDEAAFTLKKMRQQSSLFEQRFLNHRGSVYVAFSHKNPNAHRMAKQLDKGLLMLKASGEYDRIIDSTENRQ